MDAEDALNMAKDYSKLGWAVWDQAEAIIACEAYPSDMDDLNEAGELNINAVRMVKNWLVEYSEFIDNASFIIDNLESWMIGKQ
jgi:hypothetical protein